jgi:hypothetical protein
MPRAEEAEVKRKGLRSIVEPAGFGWRHWRWHVAGGARLPQGCVPKDLES